MIHAFPDIPPAAAMPAARLPRSRRWGGLLVAMSLVMAACTSGPGASDSANADDALPVVHVGAGELTYYPAGEYVRNGVPIVPAAQTVRFEHGVTVSARQISQHEYARCVAAKACRELDKAFRDLNAPDQPVVGVSWMDATAYAAWLSSTTGQNWRLPTFAEWVYVAGTAYAEDVLLQEFDEANPAQRWLAEYALETQRKRTVDGDLREFGGFGTNESGVMDIGGNVWDWTDTCHRREHLDGSGFAVTSGENCGIRVAAGAHRSYIPDFIRDPKGGACSVGVPPSHLGFRLVRES